MTRRQSNTQWSGGITAHPPCPPKIPSAKINWKSPRLGFWDQGGILLTDYLPKGQPINVEYKSSLLVRLKDFLKEKHHGKFTKGALFLHNAPANRAHATQNKLAYLAFQFLDHPPYSPDLAPSHYHLFPGMKQQLKGCHFFVQHGGHCC
jgi:histone-lysine N-methyltransferase SETMAR